MRRRTATALISAAVIGAPLALTGAAPAETADRDELHLPGLDGEVSIAVDSAGIPHITAETNEDLFYAQGVNAARDRLFQIDLHRRQGLGELSEVLGPDFVERDRAARLFLYRGDMDREWESYGPEARTTATRFAEGINAYVDWLDDNPEHRPPEFDELGYEPAHWEPEDVVRIRTHSLGENLASELTRTQVACDDELANADLLLGMEPDHTASLPEGLDPCSVPDDVLDTYRLATGDVSFDDDGSARLAGPEEDAPLTTNGGEGSNSWTVSPDHTDSGRPILAGDPHRPVTAPALRYVVHLTSPEVDVVGAGEPFLPGVAMGHNGTAAFGLTFLAADQQDLLFYDVDPDDPTRYRHDGEWKQMDTVTEELTLPDGSTEEVELRFTHHGPVISEDTDSDTAYAVRTTWTEPGTTAYFNSLELMQTEDFDAFRSVLDGWGGPPMNYTYADVHGDIGWVAAGRVPDRGDDDGLLPVPGDGSHEWDGFRDDLPYVHNPDEGFFSTANEYNQPEDNNLGYEWDPGFRQDRITEVLGGGDPHTLEEAGDLQNDDVDLTVREALPLLESIIGRDAEASAAAELLTGWDGDHTVDSAPAALYQTWFARHLGPAFYEAVSPELAAFADHTEDAGALLDALHHPEEWLDGDPEAERDRILVESLAAAYEDVAGSLGADPSQWRWGDLHHTVFEHPLDGDLGPFERQGSNHTVNRSGMDQSEYRHNAGASYRMVLDVGEWDSSLAVNGPGQSGDPDSPHYDDHVDPWREGDYVPLHYSEDAVEADTQHTIALIPQG
ncbi:penicillin acylase family protein [Nocardiopsis sp. HNM0947]|uniref:Penicillin acylase family protein n=1 Tax=Nocardiopsis coralli TaxID=2772213 RepID=A0ABR9P479_9ACTN|nr:penicillin acylase family protein [Nocardiopsis coralli]MBE2998648.1 penicillin acylase family protein [Nocardiopsis coralli]